MRTFATGRVPGMRFIWSGDAEDLEDRVRVGGEVGGFLIQLAAAECGEVVVLGFAVVFGESPGGLDPAAFFESIDGVPTTVGIRADKVNEVTELAATSLEATPRIGLRWQPEFITCIGKRNGDFIAVLDMGRIFERLMRNGKGTAAPVLVAAQADADP